MQDYLNRTNKRRINVEHLHPVSFFVVGTLRLLHCEIAASLLNFVRPHSESAAAARNGDGVAVVLGERTPRRLVEDSGVLTLGLTTDDSADALVTRSNWARRWCWPGLGRHFSSPLTDNWAETNACRLATGSSFGPLNLRPPLTATLSWPPAGDDGPSGREWQRRPAGHEVKSRSSSGWPLSGPPVRSGLELARLY